MAGTPRLICASSALADGGRGVRFRFPRYGREASGFAVRYLGQVYAYLNRCAHVPIELDWMEGEFFDASGVYLICSTHGATYEPDTGHCVAGPCKGAALMPVPVTERGGNVYWEAEPDPSPSPDSSPSSTESIDDHG